MSAQDANLSGIEDSLRVIKLQLKALEQLPKKIDNLTQELADVKSKLSNLEDKVNLSIQMKKQKELVNQINVPAEIDAVNGNRKLQSELNLVLDKIKLTNAEECNKVLTLVFPQITDRMKLADPLFKKMYRKPVYTGSYYEKLRIKDACEFDINLVLVLPAKPSQISVDAAVNPPSYALLSLKENVDELNLTDKEKSSLRSFLDNGYVVPAKLLSWIQGVIDSAKLTEISDPRVKQIKMTASGPARTLLIILKDDTEISVDLVPVFQFPYSEWPKQIKTLRQSFVTAVIDSEKVVYLVPKGYKSASKQSPHEPARKDKDRIWRMHFADIEKSVLKNNLEARPVIKLLKLLRDSQKWNNIHSYFLKTLVLNHIAANPKKEWKQVLIADRLLEMMEDLKKHLDKAFLPHFFFQTVNLFQYIKSTDSMKNRLELIIKDIRNDPQKVHTYFC